MAAFKNFAKSTLASGITSGATSMTIAAGTGVRFPAAPFNATIWNKTDYASPSDDPEKEIIRITAIATDAFTIARAQEGTAAAAHNTSGKTYGIVAGLTAGQLPLVAYVATDFLINEGSMGDVTDLTLTLAPGSYAIEVTLLFEGGLFGDMGATVELAGTLTADYFIAFGVNLKDGPVVKVGTAKTFPSGGNVIYGPCNDNVGMVHGFVNVTASGTIKIRAAADGEMFIKRGSTMRAIPV